MRFRSTCIYLALAAALALPASAQDDPWTIGDVNFSGLVDVYYQYANNHPASGQTTLRNFEVAADSFALNMVEFSAYHDADPIGFRLDLGFGKAWEIFNSFDNPTSSNNLNQFVQQAYVTVAPEEWGGFTFDFGKFFTSAGAELTENIYTWTYGRGWIYTNGPYYHFGVRVGKPITDSFSVGFQLVNGWNNLEDNNSAKTIGLTTAWESDMISWYQTYYVGAEGTSDPLDPTADDGVRHFYDTVVNLSPSDLAQFYVNFDYGNDRNLDAEWWTIGLAMHSQLNDHNGLTFRFEHYDDVDGNWLGAGPNVLRSYTATYEYKWTNGLAMRVEWRKDTSDIPYFERGNDIFIAPNGMPTAGGFGPFTGTDQSTVTVGFIGYFGS